MPIPKKDIPAHVRRCYELARKANRINHEAEVERLKFYAGGDLQWRGEEITKRRNSGRPWVTINKCKPAVDQIEGDIRLNPPGPQCHPVGEGADPDTADIHEGLIREVEYRSDAKVAYTTAGKYSAASGYGVLELETEFVSERSFAQRLRINSVEDPSTIFWDPGARMANRQDAMWAGKLRAYSREEYIAEFGSKRRVLEPRNIQTAMGWMAEAMGVGGNLAELNEWTGAGKGPYYVCEFCLVELESATLQLYSDGIARFDDEAVPKGVKPKEGAEYKSQRGRRKVTLYTVDAFEVLKETEWPGRLLRWIPVLGPEVWIDGKLHRLSLISGAIDSQRALNYVATTATELAGMMPKSPWIGHKGQFDDPKWQSANSEMWAYLEINPVWVTDETTGQSQLAPAPQRNMWETPIQWLLALAGYFSDSIKAVTAIYDPSLGAVKGDQSGKAIEQLRSESSVGNFSYADNLHRAIGVLYNEIIFIHRKILDGPRVVTIVKPDSQHELATINHEFPSGENGEKKKPLNIAFGEYSVRAMASKDFPTRQLEAVQQLQNFFSVAPQALAAPGVASRFLRMIGEGNPQVEGMADLLSPDQKDGQNQQQQMQAALMGAQQQNKVLTLLVQKLQQAMQAKLPELEFKRWQAAIDATTRIRVAEINASKDMDNAKADREADLLDSILGMAHDTTLQAREHGHAAGMAQHQAAAASMQSAQDAQQQQAQTLNQQPAQEPAESSQEPY
jgi:hypothetical protein